MSKSFALCFLATGMLATESRSWSLLRVIVVGMALGALTGCGFNAPSTATRTSAITGVIRGGDTPIAGAQIQLYAAGSSGIGSAAIPLLNQPVDSDGEGSFVIPASSCPSASSQLYLVARGGNPGLPRGIKNPSIALAAMLGACGDLNTSTAVIVNEVTTIGFVWPMASYMKSPTEIGSASGDAAFTSIAATIQQFVNVNQGSSPGIAMPESYFTQNAKLHSLANVLHMCVNSEGGTAGDGSPCGLLFSMATPITGIATTDTMSAAMRVAQSPYNEVSGLYSLTRHAVAFLPMLVSAPLDWTLSLSHLVAARSAAGVPAKLVFLQQPSTTLASATIAPAVTVAEEDANGNVVATAINPVTMAVTGGTRLVGKLTLPPLNGVATFGNLVISKVGTGYTLSAASPGLTPATSASFAVTAPVGPSPVKLVFLQQPSTTLASAAIAPAVTVAEEDANGNVVASAINPVTMAVTGGTRLVGKLTLPPFDGVATFSNLVIGKVGAGYTLSATSPGLTSATSAAFTISSTMPAPAVKLAFVQQPSDVTEGSTVSPAVTVAVEDSSGNTSATATNPITIALTSGTGLGGTLTAVPQNGIATFSNLSVTAAGTYALTASNPGLSVATSSVFTVSAVAPTGTTYYLSANGSDSNNGWSPSAPWLTPNHALNCGDVISAAPGTNYSAKNFYTGKWGTVNCPAGNSVAWLRCATFDACKISTTVNQGMWVDKSYWGVEGWEITTSAADTYGTCFLAAPATASIHHIIFANNVANGCSQSGFQSINRGMAGVDYFSVVGNIAFNAAQGAESCTSGISVYQPVESDSLTGTHIYVAGNFAYGNLEPSQCAGTSPTDGEGIIFDTFDGSQGGLPQPYAAQAVAENNIVVGNGGRGIQVLNNSAGPSYATIYVKNNTSWGNLIDPNQHWLGCGEIQLNLSSDVQMTGNLVSTGSPTGCGGNPIYAFAISSGNNTDSIDSNFAYGYNGDTEFKYASGAFAYGSLNTVGISPQFSNAIVPNIPACSGATNVPGCMADMIANFKPQNTAAHGSGYQEPSGTPVSNPLFPTWLCTANIPSGLVTLGCKEGP